MVVLTGFLSIDCGSDTNYLDSKTGIYWVTDDDYISTGTNIKNITVESYDPIPNSGQVGTLRYFNASRSRNCYVVPVEPNASYLVRPTFFYGDLGNASSPIQIRVFLDNTRLDTLTFTAGNVPFYTFSYKLIYVQKLIKQMFPIR